MDDGLNIIFSLEVFFSLEDYGNFNMIRSNIQSNVLVNDSFGLKKTKITKTCVRVSFPFEDKEKEIIMEKYDLKKIYKFIRIYSNERNFINILINREERNDIRNDIINKINENRNVFRGAIRVNLKISEFPIKNYILIDKEKEKEDNEFEHIFYLKKKSINNNMINNNNTNNIQNQQLNENISQNKESEQNKGLNLDLLNF